MEKATYDSTKTLSDARHGTHHHFQEGNLPNNSKCVKCKKTCWSPDSLTGMRCQWCGMSAHSSCLPNMPNSHGVCQFGLLEPIFLSPQAISIPRSQLTQDRSIAKSHALMQARKSIILFKWSNQVLDMSYIPTYGTLSYIPGLQSEFVSSGLQLKETAGWRTLQLWNFQFRPRLFNP